MHYVKIMFKMKLRDLSFNWGKKEKNVFPQYTNHQLNVLIAGKLQGSSSSSPNLLTQCPVSDQEYSNDSSLTSELIASELNFHLRFYHKFTYKQRLNFTPLFLVLKLVFVPCLPQPVCLIIPSPTSHPSFQLIPL